MDEAAREFGRWLDRQTLQGMPAQRVGDRRWILFEGPIRASATIAPIAAGDAVELRLQRPGAEVPSFLTRFALADGPRSRMLTRELAAALEAELRRGATQVLVCHAPGEDVEAFADALNAHARRVAVSYAFEAGPPGADAAAKAFSAILLTPQAASLADRDETMHMGSSRVGQAQADTVTFALPPSVLAGCDARAAFDLLTEALCEVDAGTCHTASQRPLRPLPSRGRALIINVTHCDRCVRMGYRLYEGDDVRARGAVAKARIDLEDLHDFLLTLELAGIEPSRLDVIGITTPGVVNFCSMNMPSTGLRDVDLVEELTRRYGIPTYIDNSTNAAAMGCYLLRPDCQSLTLYRHQLGHKNGGQGTVIDGRLVKGHSNMAGEPKFYQRMFGYEGGYANAVWNARGLSLIARNVLLATIGTVSPDVACVAINAIDDIDALRDELERALPRYCIPELVRVGDYRDCMYLGEASLCLGRLR